MEERYLKELKSISSATDWFRVVGTRDDYVVQRLAAFAIAVIEGRGPEGKIYPLGEVIVGVSRDCIDVAGNELEHYLPPDTAGCLHISQLDWKQQEQQFVVHPNAMDELFWD